MEGSGLTNPGLAEGSSDQDSLHHRVVVDLQQFIVSQGLKPGTRLPSEAELCQRLGVARPTLREGLRALQTLGIIEVKRGHGMYVRDYNLAPALQVLSYQLQVSDHDFRELIEMREALEVYCLTHTVGKLRRTELRTLRDLVDRMEQKVKQGEDFLEEDIAFHRVLAEAADRRILLQLLDVFWGLVRQRGGRVRRDTDPSRYSDHRLLLEAVEKGDLALSQRLMALHFQRAYAELDDLQSEASR